MTTITGDPYTVAGVEAGKYIRAIRNQQKKEYARAYLLFIFKGKRGEAPARGALSYAAAQAVRMQLDSIFETVGTAGPKQEDSCD